MTPANNLSLSVQQQQSEQNNNALVPVKEPIVPSELENIRQITSLPRSTSSSYLLTNLVDPEVRRLRKSAIEENVDGWSAAQTTHRKSENDSINNGVLLLTQRYEKIVKPTIEDIKTYIKANKEKLQQNGFSTEDFVFLDVYLDKTKYIIKDNELLQLCWLALGDSNAICAHCDLSHLSPNAMCAKRKELFLKGLIQRLNENAICGHGTYNAIYEAMQCLHPDTKRIMDLAAIQDLITLTVQEVLLDYLRSHLDLRTQLNIIKVWLENSAEGHSIFTHQEQNLEQQIIDKICQKFHAKGYNNLSDKDIQVIKKQFHATPLFLRDFENLEIEFTDEIYLIKPNINNLEEHVKYFKKKSLDEKYSDYRAALPESIYESFIEKLLNEKIETNKKQMSKSVFGFITEKLKNDTILLDLFLRKVINNNAEHYNTRITALFMRLSNMYVDKRSPAEIINIMSRHGSAEEIMWLLCYFYHNTKNDNSRTPFRNLIIFLFKLGVKTEDCFKLNVNATELLITAKLKPDQDILNCVPTNIHAKHEVKQALYDKHLYQNAINIYSYCFLVGILIGCIVTFSALPILSILGALLPVALLSECFSIPKYFLKLIKFLTETTENIQVTSNQKKLYRDFFASSHNSSDKIFSPLYKIANLFKTSIISYSQQYFDNQGYANDYAQPVYGFKHIIKGLFKIASSPLRLFGSNSSFSAVPIQVANGMTTIIRGLTEIVTAPFTYLIKIPFRIGITFFRKQYQQRNMMSLALDLQSEIADISNTNDNDAVSSDSPININTPLLDKVNHSSKKISDKLFNKAANLHKEYKEFKSTTCPAASQFQKDEKIKWKEVKLAFFKNMIDKKTDAHDKDKNAIIDYCRVFTR